MCIWLCASQGVLRKGEPLPWVLHRWFAWLGLAKPNQAWPSLAMPGKAWPGPASLGQAWSFLAKLGQAWFGQACRGSISRRPIRASGGIGPHHIYIYVSIYTYMYLSTFTYIHHIFEADIFMHIYLYIYA